MKRTRFLLFVAAIFGNAGLALGHEVRPGYWELRQTAPETYRVTWKVPLKGGLRLGLYAVLPTHCIPKKTPTSFVAEGAFIERNSFECPGGLTGHTIGVDGLASTMTDVSVRLERLDGNTQVVRLSPSAPSFVVEAAPNRIQVAGTYLRLGIEHILLGIDHLLFVACLMFVAGSKRRLFITITGSTLAHSVTLVLSALDLVQLPIPPVEAAIALSIVFVAVEIAHGRETSLTFRYAIAVSASFGLLHGFGFAAVLREIGLPQNDIPTALLFFNIGVEIGQVLLIAGLIVLMHLGGRVFAPRLDGPAHALAMRVRMPAAYLIGSIASYWLIARIGALA